MKNLDTCFLLKGLKDGEIQLSFLKCVVTMGMSNLNIYPS